MARKKKAKPKEPDAPPVIRSTLHLVQAGRKPARHRRWDEKRAPQKLRRDLDQE